MIVSTRAQRRQLERNNAKLSTHLQEVPRETWPDLRIPVELQRVLRSRDFLVQVFSGTEPVLARLSINRTTQAGDRWQDLIAWEDLQRIKNECGFAECDAVEVFPAARDVVNVANMRHLWVMRERLPYAWRGRE